MDIKLIIEKFHQYFEGAPLVIKAPGRINIIGEHTDYNEGFVLPAAIDKEIVFAIRANNQEKSNIRSIDFDESVAFDTSAYKPFLVEHQWANYVLGVVDEIKKEGFEVGNFDCVFGGDVPVGAGLSSSAAVESGIAVALNELFNLHLDKLELIKIAQRAENNFVGVKCGIMDQFASVLGQEDNVLLLDCRSLEYSHFPLELPDHEILLCDTGVKHSLASSEYNTRRNECEEGVKKLQEQFPQIKSLRDVKLDMLYSVANELDPVIMKRCLFVVKENIRVLKACEDLTRNDLSALGNLIYESHEGLRSNYEVSCTELDYLVDTTKKDERVLGARMMGGGFGGCTINIVESDHVEGFTKHISEQYSKTFGKELKTYKVKVSDGVRIIKNGQLV